MVCETLSTFIEGSILKDNEERADESHQRCVECCRHACSHGDEEHAHCVNIEGVDACDGAQHDDKSDDGAKKPQFDHDIGHKPSMFGMVVEGLEIALCHVMGGYAVMIVLFSLEDGIA